VLRGRKRGASERVNVKEQKFKRLLKSVLWGEIEEKSYQDSITVPKTRSENPPRKSEESSGL